ncbi:hypothetical protein ISCGN_015213 [Ixodes scapularis]
MEAARLMTRGQRSFSELKRHVFEYLGLSANRLRELFGETVKLPDETWWSASVRARTLLDAYLDSRKVKSFEKLKDLLISDRIKVMATAEVARHVVLTECGDWMKPKELSRCLEHFDETKRICLKTEHAPEKPKVAEKTGAKQSRDKKRRKCFACKAVGHLISECPAVDPRRETRTLDVPETSEVGDFTERNTDSEDRASRKTRFKEELARLHWQFRAAFHERSGRGLGGVEMKIRLIMNAKNLAQSTSRNTIAELRGSTSPDEVVLVSGHLDSWDVGQGAMDDGGGAFISWRALSVLRSLDLRPRRTLRSVLWTGEEEGNFGARAYYDRHQSEAPNMNIVMESDQGTFKPLGLMLASSNPTARCMVKHVVDLMGAINATWLTLGESGSDVEQWVQQGVPGGYLATADDMYYYFHHSEGDTMTVEDPVNLDLCTAFWAAVSFVFADLSERLPR